MNRPQDFTAADDRAVAAGQKGGAIRAAGRKGETITRLCLAYPGSQPTALRAAYDAGYRAGTQAQYQAAKRRAAE